MKTLSIQITEVLILRSGASMDEVAKDFQVLLALHYFRTGMLRSGQAAEMAGENRVDFILRAGAEGIAVADLDAAELADEVAHAAPDR